MENPGAEQRKRPGDRRLVRVDQGAERGLPGILLEIKSGVRIFHADA